MSIIYETVGISGSGKSTWAKKFAAEHPNTKIVSPDSFREMLNGEYKYLVELDDVITQSCFDTAENLLRAGYDVIIDCGNLTTDPDRRGKWAQLQKEEKEQIPGMTYLRLYEPTFIAIVMPMMDDEWHVQNRMKKPHWDKVDWHDIVRQEKATYQPPTFSEFDEIWRMSVNGDIQITKIEKELK